MHSCLLYASHSAWQGKRIIRVPGNADTAIWLRMDISWVDDGGIPWNPSIR